MQSPDKTSSEAPQAKSPSFGGIRWTGLSAVFSAILSLAQIPILAHLLSPSDFGLMAIVMSVMAFAQMFADAGVSNALIHKQDISQQQLSSLYWLNVTSSTVLALILFALGYGVAYYYRQPQLHLLLSMTALSLLLSSFGLQLRVLAQKALHFDRLAKVEMVGATAGFLTATSSAWLGCGVYSIVFGNLASATAILAMSWTTLANGWRPELRLDWPEIRPFLKFGAYMVGNDLANTINGQIDVLLGGRILSSTALGLYNLPKSLALRVQFLVNPIITKVGFPVMAKVQHDPQQLRRIYLSTLNLTASVNFPIYAAMAFFAEPIVALVFGKQWLMAAPIMQILAIWGAVRSTANPIGSLLLAKGRADLSFRWNIALLGVFPPALWIGSHFGTIGMAYALLTSQLLLFVPGWYFLIRPMCGATLLQTLTQFLRPSIVSLFFLGMALIGSAYTNKTWHILLAAAGSLVALLMATYPLWASLGIRLRKSD